MADFQATFDNTKDMIYGRGEWINVYVHYYRTGERKAPGDMTTGERQACATDKQENFFAINTFNRFMTNARYIKEQAPETAAYLGNYEKGLKASRYQPIDLNVKGGVQYDSTFKKSNAALTSASDRRAIRAAAMDLSIRRSCKFGIDYVTKKLEGTIHYVLDGIDVAKVCDKATITNGSGYEKIPICTSELRYLFRNWSRLKDGKIVFWNDFDECAPPWQTTEDKKWAAYALARMEKFWGNLRTAAGFQAMLVQNGADHPQDFAKVKAFLMSKLTARKFVDVFHTIPSEYINREDFELV